MALRAKRCGSPGTPVRNDFFAENEIQIGELGEDRQGIFVSFLSSVRRLLDVSVLFYKSRVV